MSSTTYRTWGNVLVNEIKQIEQNLRFQITYWARGNTVYAVGTLLSVAGPIDGKNYGNEFVDYSRRHPAISQCGRTDKRK